MACRQLGLPHQDPKSVLNAFYGAGSGPVWIGNIRCNGTETLLVDCKNGGWRTPDCNHDNDASVSCTGRIIN